MRAYLGHARLDTPEQVALLNETYELMWVCYNLFQPVMHLESKTHEGGRLARRCDEARTPYQRLALTGSLGDDARGELDGLYERTNPRELRNRIRAMLGRLWDLSAGEAA